MTMSSPSTSPPLASAPVRLSGGCRCTRSTPELVRAIRRSGQCAGSAQAGTIIGASFLANFVGKTPWAHLDIAAAWDLGRAYVGKGASGYGVRLLVELARSYCA